MNILAWVILNWKEVIMRKKKTNTIVIATAITTLLSATTAAFADTTSLNTAQTPEFRQTQSGKMYDFPNSHLVSLINSGTLTQTQKDAIQCAILTDPKVSTAKGKLKRGDNGGFKTVLIGLVKTATLNQAQNGAIPVRSQKLGEGGTAIESGTIT